MSAKLAGNVEMSKRMKKVVPPDEEVIAYQRDTHPVAKTVVLIIVIAFVLAALVSWVPPLANLVVGEANAGLVRCMSTPLALLFLYWWAVIPVNETAFTRSHVIVGTTGGKGVGTFKHEVIPLDDIYAKQLLVTAIDNEEREEVKNALRSLVPASVDEVPGEAFDRVVPAEKSELKIEADNILDCTGEFGPTQFSKVKNFLESLEKGQVGMVLISDPGSLPPVKALGLESGYELLKTEEADGLSSIYIKKT